MSREPSVPPWCIAIAKWILRENGNATLDEHGHIRGQDGTDLGTLWSFQWDAETGLFQLMVARPNGQWLRLRGCDPEAPRR